MISRSAATSVSSLVITLVELKATIRFNDGLKTWEGFASNTASAVQ